MYLNINNQEVYYQKLGQGPNLILLHGWKQDVSTFHDVSEILKKHFTLWLIDLPGFGRSENPKKPFYVKDFADIVAEFIKQNKLTKPHLLGHSLSGRVAIKLGSESGDILGKVVLEDAAGIKPKETLGKKLKYVLAKLFKIVPNIFHLKERLRNSAYKKMGSDYLNAGALKDTLINILSEDQTKELSKINNQALIIWGENDNLNETTTNNARKMYRLIKNSRLEFIPNASHFPHTENPKMFLYYVLDFLT